MSKKMPARGLGRGFDSLIPTTVLDEAFDPSAAEDRAVSELRTIAVNTVSSNPHQPRRLFEPNALQELANSIKEHGVLQPIVVTQKDDASYELVAGERRLRASQLAGLAEIPALVRTYKDQHKLELALIENLNREDLNPLEIATAYLKLQQQFNLTLDEIGKRSGGKALSTISNTMRLLALPENAKTALIGGQIAEGHARQILAIQEPAVQQELLDLVIQHDWSVRKTEQFVIGYKEGKKNRLAAAAKTRTETPSTERLAKRLGTKVSIRNMAHGGRLIIEFTSDDDLERITSSLLT
ncbi:MAG TPA: ParB/RepB/Spo0J family partition protein [Magnetospirillaceae bacterium]|nr:ParB/RepB/Spo0J family partition protein [Magnetospirillaceae bacterium]